MSNYKFVFILLLSAVGLSQAQVRIVNSINNSVATNSSAFIDASSNSTTNATTNIGKGLIFPRTDLTTFTSFSGTPTGIATSYPNRFDGMVVYNTATSGVAGVGATQGTLTAGYWYYDNKSTTVTGGTWKPVAAASSSAVNILTTETTTNTLINSAQVYAIKGTFTASGNSTAVNIPAPAGMTGLYGITIYKSGSNTVYSRDLYSYTIATTAGNAITGSPTVSVVYPAGTYDYVLEYLK
ncbi:hypothetical protein [Chryseobacterium sp.]|uniref:hypothetical protein n=1 Tax=Chryseobacterium sp. TaxID=1871047 RepID=UPI0025B8BBFA|nr:hypothetical protein [Chryseobacterium sp.]